MVTSFECQDGQHVGAVVREVAGRRWRLGMRSSCGSHSVVAMWLVATVVRRVVAVDVKFLEVGSGWLLDDAGGVGVLVTVPVRRWVGGEWPYTTRLWYASGRRRGRRRVALHHAIVGRQWASASGDGQGMDVDIHVGADRECRRWSRATVGVQCDRSGLINRGEPKRTRRRRSLLT